LGWIIRVCRTQDRVSFASFLEASAALPRILRERRVLSERVEHGFRLVEDGQLKTGARRCVR
jgi:hypothetical protein